MSIWRNTVKNIVFRISFVFIFITIISLIILYVVRYLSLIFAFSIIFGSRFYITSILENYARSYFWENLFCSHILLDDSYWSVFLLCVSAFFIILPLYLSSTVFFERLPSFLSRSKISKRQYFFQDNGRHFHLKICKIGLSFTKVVCKINYPYVGNWRKNKIKFIFITDWISEEFSSSKAEILHLSYCLSYQKVLHYKAIINLRCNINWKMPLQIKIIREFKEMLMLNIFFIDFSVCAFVW